jgi:hypothetical protein
MALLGFFYMKKIDKNSEYKILKYLFKLKKNNKIYLFLILKIS